MLQPVGEVSQVGARRAELLRNRYGLLDIEVRGMRVAVPQRAQDEHIQITQQLLRIRRNLLGIDDQGRVSHPETVASIVPVWTSDRQQREARHLDLLSIGERGEL